MDKLGFVVGSLSELKQMSWDKSNTSGDLFGLYNEHKCILVLTKI